MKRWPLRILLCLILLTGGAITTVAVAWGFAAFGPITTRQPDANWDELLEDWWYKNRPDSVDAAPFRPDLEEGSTVTWGASGMEFVRITGVVPDSGRADFTARRWRCGWPFVALEGSEWSRRDEDRTKLRVVGIAIDPPAWTDVQEVWSFLAGRLLPVTPLRWGFLIDTIFYGAIWGGVWFGIVGGKRFIRRKRGRCPRCGYDLRGNLAAGCSECGWGRIPIAPGDGVQESDRRDQHGKSK